MMSEIFDCPITTDNDVEIDYSSEPFQLEDNSDLTQFSNLLDSVITGEVTVADLDAKSMTPNMFERIET